MTKAEKELREVIGTLGITPKAVMEARVYDEWFDRNKVPTEKINTVTEIAQLLQKLVKRELDEVRIEYVQSYAIVYFSSEYFIRIWDAEECRILTEAINLADSMYFEEDDGRKECVCIKFNVRDVFEV